MNERSFSEVRMAIEAPFTPEHDLFRRTLRDYVTRELAPHALEWDEAGTQLDMLSMRGEITDAQHRQGRDLLIQVARMLKALCGPPR